MKITAAVIKEQEVTFAIIIINNINISNNKEANEIQRAYSKHFSNIPIILMTEDSNGTPTYHGRTDIVAFLNNIEVSRIPWKQYNFED